MYILYLLRSVQGLSLLEIPVNLSQYRGSKSSHSSYLSYSNIINNNNLAIRLLILLNKIALVLLLLKLMFMFKGNTSKHKKFTFIWILFFTFVSCKLLCWLYILLITLSGNVEINRGPKREAASTFSVCHWNLSSICAHNIAKLFLLRAYVRVDKFDIICLSETYLDSSIDNESS